MILIASAYMRFQNDAKQSLQNRSFKGLDLTGVDFSGAALQGCDFSGATLVGANLTGVTTGKSLQQRQRLIVTAIVAPTLMIGLLFLVVQIPVQLLGDRFYQGLNTVLGWLPLLLLPLEMFFRDSMTQRFPRTTNVFGLVSIAALFQIMVVFTLILAMLSLSNFGDGNGAQGLFLLVLAVLSTIVTRRIFKWVVAAIQSSGGTSFRQANLTDANLSQGGHPKYRFLLCRPDRSVHLCLAHATPYSICQRDV